MSGTWIAVLAALIAVFGLAFVISKLLTLRTTLAAAGAAAEAQIANMDTSDLGLSTAGPTVVHFTAQWCAPCVSVRKVVDEVCADLPAVAHLEVDIDANPEAARKLSVLSLPTTFVFDAGGRQRYRTSGVPTASDLRSALEPLLA
ncbi:thioredoxin family protein [Mycolicibacterium hippocampi]|uniref:thioredoxin family protein n=1 Tax=Mycolicibacterium hippocampi TaxID=659824 RepID=UPI003517951D